MKDGLSVRDSRTHAIYAPFAAVARTLSVSGVTSLFVRHRAGGDLAVNSFASSDFGNMQVISRLQEEPVKRLATEVSRKPQSGITGDTAPPEEDVVYSRWRNPKGFRECSRTEPSGLHEVFAQNLSGMQRRPRVFAHRKTRSSASPKP